MTASSSSITALAFRTPALAAGRPGTADPTGGRLLAGTAGGEVVSWAAPPPAFGDRAATSPPPLPLALPCRRVRPTPPTARLARHAGPVRAVVVGLGGVVASGGDDRTVSLWAGTTADADTPGTTLTGHQGTIWGLATAPAPPGLGGARSSRGGATHTPVTPPPSTLLLLSCSADKTARLWALPADGVAAAASARPAPHMPVATLAGHHTDWVRACDLAGSGVPSSTPSFSASSACLALTGGDDGRAVLWDVGTGVAVRVVRGAGGGACSSSSRPFAAVRAVRFVGAAGRGGGRLGAAFATGAADGTLTLWDARAGAAIGTLTAGEDGAASSPAHAGGVTALAVAAGGAPSTFSSTTTLASVGADGAARAWDLRSRRRAGPAPARVGACPLTAVAWTPCGRGLAVGGADGGVCVVGL